MVKFVLLTHGLQNPLKLSGFAAVWFIGYKSFNGVTIVELYANNRAYISL